MDFSISLNFITGAMIGIEFTHGDDEEDNGRYMVIDLLIVRLVFGIYPEQ